MLSTIGASSIPVSSYVMQGPSSGRLSVPVNRAEAIYAQFSHVSGVPSENGVSIDKISILNSLIEGLSRMRSDGNPATRAARDGQGLTGGRIDALIDQYSGQLKDASQAKAASRAAVASQAKAYIPQPLSLNPGSAFSFLA